MQMVSDVPIGAFLSGGIDSSAVVAFMARHIEPAGPDLLDRLRRRRGRALLQRTATTRGASLNSSAPITTRSWSSPMSSRLLPKLLWHMDEPIADTAFITTYLVSEFARRDVKVILSGVGGDELFGGYRRYLGEHYRSGISDWLPRWARARRRWLARRAAERPPLEAAERTRAWRRASSAAPSIAVRPSATAPTCGVFGREDVAARCSMHPPAGASTRSARAFRGAGGEDALDAHVRGRCRRPSCPTTCCC